VSPSPSTRQAYISFRSELHTSSPTSAPIISPAHIKYLRSLTVHLHPSLSLYMHDLFTAARHHHELDGTLLTARAHKDAEALIRAQRVLCGDSTSTQLIRSIRVPDNTSENSKFMLHEIHDDMKTVKEDLGDGNEERSFRDEGRKLGVLDDPWGHEDDFFWQLHGDTRMDVSEVDVAKIVPRVISHRLKVRDGPDHEILSGAIYPAASPILPKVDKHQKTVKDIIVEILVDT